MSLIEFRTQLLDLILNFLWRQWSALGILGTAGAEDEWIIDPESLLVFSVGMARYEPRLFDEVLSWLPLNGEWLDLARLRTMIRRLDAEQLKVMGGTIHWAQRFADHRKWNGLAKMATEIQGEQKQDESLSPLFREKSGKGYPFVESDRADERFARFSINRPKFENPRIGSPAPVTAGTNIRFFLRSLLGIGAKSECVLYLLTHEGGRVQEIADETGFFWLSAAQTLSDLARSGLVLTRSQGKGVEYWLSQKRWWVFLTHQDTDQFRPPKWVNWSAIFPALVIVWNTVDSLSRELQTEYFTASRLQQALEVLHREFSRAGVDVPPLPNMGLPTDMYQQATAAFVLRLLGGKQTVKA